MPRIGRVCHAQRLLKLLRPDAPVWLAFSAVALLLVASPSASSASRHLSQLSTVGTGAVVVWPQPPGNKVRPFDLPVAVGAPAHVMGGRGEGAATQIVLTNTTAAPLADLSPELGPLVGTSSSLQTEGAVQLYRVGYVDVQVPSDPAGATGEWPDALYPIGPDRYFHEVRNGAPFELGAGRNQSVWIEIRIPPDAAPGIYTAGFRVLQAGVPVAELPFSLTVWNFRLPDTPALASTAALDTWTTFCAHYYPGETCLQSTPALDQLVDLYLREGAAHHVTLTTGATALAYVYDAASDRVTSVDWASWDHLLQWPGASSYPLPPPAFAWNDPAHVWSDAELREAIAVWRASSDHYRANGWFDRSFLYTYDEPGHPRNGFTAEQQKHLVAQQSRALHAADPELRALVTSSYDPYLAANGAIGIWAPAVQQLTGSPDLQATYADERSAGRRAWWYDSNDSREPDAPDFSGVLAHHGNWPDQFIDHPGANQLVHGALSWKYRLEGYLYYEVTAAYQVGNVWHANAYAGANGDGTLFYPGRPQDIGGSTHIPVPSIRLQLLREAFSFFDELSLLAGQGRSDAADAIVDRLVTSPSQWSHDPEAYERAREDAARLLSGPAPAVVLETDLTLAPMAPGAGKTVEARFAARNVSQGPVTIPYFLVAARDPSGANVDFPRDGPVTLGPGETYVYDQSRALSVPGSYSLWAAFFDGSTWVELGPQAAVDVH